MSCVNLNHRKVFMSFVQQYTELFMLHGEDSMICQTKLLFKILFIGLDETTRSWINYGALTTGYHLFNIYYDSWMDLLYDMIDFDYHRHCDTSLQGWNHQYPPEFYYPNYTNQPFEHQEECSAGLDEIVTKLEDMLTNQNAINNKF